jgi:NAD(P)H dehydrogenase (quinone)
MNVRVVFYSTYGHVWRMAEAVAEGATSVDGANVRLLQVPETLPSELLEQIGALEAREQFAKIPIAGVDDIADADALLIGTPTRFGNMAAQMRAFLDGTGGLWQTGALVGKVGSAFTSTGTQHGGQETTLISIIQSLLHHGMLIAGVPYSHGGLSNMDEITGGTPYGATTLAGADGGRMPSANELDIARFQGEHVATIAAKLFE